jgi:hypothetical protein
MISISLKTRGAVERLRRKEPTNAGAGLSGVRRKHKTLRRDSTQNEKIYPARTRPLALSLSGRNVARRCIAA